jgi:hypothetical protein
MQVGGSGFEVEGFHSHFPQEKSIKAAEDTTGTAGEA